MAHNLTSLVQIIEQNQYHLILDAKPQIESLLEKALCLRDIFVNNYSTLSADARSALELQITDAAHAAEDLIESRVIHQDQSSELDLMFVMQVLDSIKGQVSVNVANSPSLMVHQVLETENMPSQNKVLVGIEEEFMMLKEQLLAKSPKLYIIPIVGVGGIGKTTLAQTLYNDYSIASNFHIRAWVTISQEFNIHMTLLAILEGLGKPTKEIRRESIEKLGEYVRNTLRDSKYFIVLDDIWDIKAWHTVRSFLPDNRTRSRILLTTRMGDLADSAASSEPLRKFLLNKEDSWNLFCNIVFQQPKYCPADLNDIGKYLTELCDGLPLSGTLIAGLVATSKKTKEFWESLAHGVQSAVGLQYESENSFFVILNLIFNLLPHYLKPCFLYIGAFPEDYEIRASRIIKMWIAEGFIGRDTNKSMEDTAEAYLKTIGHMNLILVSHAEPNGRIKSFKIHDMVRDFCLKKALKENFLWYKDLHGLNIPKDQRLVRRVSARTFSRNTRELELTAARSILCIFQASLHFAPMFSRSRYLRVLDIFELEFYQFPAEILQLVLLRYLSFSCHANLTSSISKLRYLQTLIIRRLPSFRAFSLPSELWELSKLRHVKSKETCIWCYPKNMENVILWELETLSNVQIFGVTNEFLGHIPNIRKFGVFCNIAMNKVVDLACLHKLETLKCSSDWSLASRDFLSFLTFPPSLKKVCLSLCKIPWGFMSMLGALPYLEQLKLQKSDFLGVDSNTTEREWEPKVGEFSSLISLQMEDLNLAHWKANSTHFPRLRNLIIRRCPIAKISIDIGNIPTIELIEVDKFIPSLLASAIGIREEQQDRGNYLLQVLDHARHKIFSFSHRKYFMAGYKIWMRSRIIPATLNTNRGVAKSGNGCQT